MRLPKVVKDVAYWLQDNTSRDVDIQRLRDSCVLSFTMITTNTRASSVVTRVKLIVAELAHVPGVCVDKEPMSEVPRGRSTVVPWRIFVRIPMKVKKEKTNGSRIGDPRPGHV